MGNNLILVKYLKDRPPKSEQLKYNSYMQALDSAWHSKCLFNAYLMDSRMQSEVVGNGDREELQLGY